MRHHATDTRALPVWAVWLAAALLIALAVTLLFAAQAMAAVDGAQVLAQQSPYEPPQLTQVDLPSWAEPLEPLARLPLWAQAALGSATVVGAFFVIPAVARRVWGLFAGPDGRGS